MKTLKDLFNLILEETELNSGKIVNYFFDINTHYKWLSMYEKHEIENGESKTLISNQKIETEAQIQLVYWTIYSIGRTQYNENK